MKIVILGATGFVGRNVLKQGLEASHEVTVLVRDARKLGSDNSKLKVIEGDARKYQDVKKAITGQDVVIQTLGLGGQGYGKPNDTVSQATRILVDIMSQEKRGYLVCVSNAGVGSSENFGPWWMRKLSIRRQLTCLVGVN